MRLVIVALFAIAAAAAQTPPLTISRAVQIAVERYPSVRVSEEQLAASRGAINLARTAYLPRMDMYGQVNRATHNSLYSLLLPQTVIPNISGPVTPTTFNNVFDTAVGMLVSWEPFDFGLRRANVAVGEAGEKHAQAAVRRTQFDVAALTADAYLTLAAAEQMVRAAQAAVDRTRVLEKMIGAVVRAELRPGVDLSRTQAERALAETQLAQSRQAAEIGRATLAEMLGLEPSAVAIEPGKLLDAPPGTVAEANPSQHPRAVEQQAAIDEVKAREKALDREYFPRFNLQASTYGRGSGANLDGTSGDFLSGLGPNTGNWAVGFSVFFPIFDYASLRARRETETHHERAESARLEQVIRELKGQHDRAAASYEGARQIAANTPQQLQSAHDTEQQATARYRAGLGTAIEVADAERILTQSEIDDRLAKLNIWRALLAMASASGNLDSFLDQTK
jgi:outer membrane protein